MRIEEATVSVVVTSYNYGDYVGAAIESALALDWPRVEVIVVDDGSTDHSLRVIEGFGTRIATIAQQRGGEAAACNRGFARSRGELVVFLDSDDMLDPSLLREVAAAWTPRASKAQVQMRAIDAAGRPTGTCFPQYESAPAPSQLRRWALASTSYPSPCGSGNVYARWFLERIFPLPERCAHTGGRPGFCRICSAADTYCLAAAPLLGDVVTIPAPLVSYRVHGRNWGAISTLQDTRRLADEAARGMLREAHARSAAAAAGLAMREGAVNRSLHHLGYRLASLKLDAESHPLKGDSLWRAAADCWAAVFVPQGLGVRRRFFIFAWACAVAVAPRSLAATLVLWRFSPSARPRVLRRALEGLAPVR